MAYNKYIWLTSFILNAISNKTKYDWPGLGHMLFFAQSATARGTSSWGILYHGKVKHFFFFLEDVKRLDSGMHCDL